MKRMGRGCVVAVGLVGLLIGPTLATGQTAPEFPPSLNTEQNPLRNVSAGALGGRSPGNMVSAGVARTLAAADFGRSIIEITEPRPGPDPRATFLIEAIKTIFDQIDQAISLLENVLRLRAGLLPQVPVDIAGSGDGDTTNLGDLGGLVDGGT